MPSATRTWFRDIAAKTALNCLLIYTDLVGKPVHTLTQGGRVFTNGGLVLANPLSGQ